MAERTAKRSSELCSSRVSVLSTHIYITSCVSVVFMLDGFRSLPIFVCSFFVMSWGHISILVAVGRCSRDNVLSTHIYHMMCPWFSC